MLNSIMYTVYCIIQCIIILLPSFLPPHIMMRREEQRNERVSTKGHTHSTQSTIDKLEI